MVTKNIVISTDTVVVCIRAKRDCHCQVELEHIKRSLFEDNLFIVVEGVTWISRRISIKSYPTAGLRKQTYSKKILAEINMKYVQAQVRNAEPIFVLRLAVL